MADVEITTAPEPVKVTVTRFDCPFCGSRFRSSRKANVADHMTRCWSDPAKKTCRTCAHFERAAYADAEDSCALGVAVPQDGPVIGCPVWRDRDEEEVSA